MNGWGNCCKDNNKMQLRLKVSGYKVISTEKEAHGLLRHKQLSAKLQYFIEEKWQDVPIVDEDDKVIHGPITVDINRSIFERL